MSQESGVRSQKSIFVSMVLLAAVFTFLPACSSKKEEAPKVEKVKKFVPENKVVTAEKLEQWLTASERVGEFIHKFALENEDIRNKDDFMFLAHSSTRTEAILTSLFNNLELKQGEFWWILERLEEAKQYAELKAQEETQNSRIEKMLAAGRDEIADTKKRLEREKDDSMRKDLVKSLDGMNAKFSEFSSLKGSTTPEKIGLKPENIEIWTRNRDRIETAIAKMWKITPGHEAELERDKSIPGH